jgi:hypothetical protein
MSFTNEKLTIAIKQNEFPTFEDLIPHIKEMVDNIEPINESNKQLIVAKYDLKNIGEIFTKLNANGGNYYSNNESILNQKVQKKEFSANELAEVIESTFLNYKKGFGYILTAFIVAIINAIGIYIAISNLNVNNLNDLENYRNIGVFISIICIVLFFIGIAILYESSQLKKKNG